MRSGILGTKLLFEVTFYPKNSLTIKYFHPATNRLDIQRNHTPAILISSSECFAEQLPGMHTVHQNPQMSHFSSLLFTVTKSPDEFCPQKINIWIRNSSIKKAEHYISQANFLAYINDHSNADINSNYFALRTVFISISSYTVNIRFYHCAASE